MNYKKKITKLQLKVAKLRLKLFKAQEINDRKLTDEFAVASEAISSLRRLSEVLECKPSEVVETVEGMVNDSNPYEGKDVLATAVEEVEKHTQKTDRGFVYESVLKVTEKDLEELAIIQATEIQDDSYQKGVFDMMKVFMGKYLGVNIEKEPTTTKAHKPKVYTEDNWKEAPDGVYDIYNSSTKKLVEYCVDSDILPDCWDWKPEHVALYIRPLPPNELPQNKEPF